MRHADRQSHFYLWASVKRSHSILAENTATMAHHRAAAFACLVLALLASQAAAGAVNSSPLLVEKLTPSSHTAAKLASGYYETSKSELCTSTIKNCAAFGCADGECSVTYPDVAFE